MPINQLTSPEILDQKERIWTAGVAYDPFDFEVPATIYSFQPVVGYRSGIGSKQEIGVKIYGVYYPGVVLDHKHRIAELGGFKLSGDLSGYGRIYGIAGFQYDLLFGNRYLYGTCGLNYEFVGSQSYWIVGIGSEFTNSIPFGIQLSYGNDFNNDSKMISIGVKFDLLNLKKKYRNRSDSE